MNLYIPGSSTLNSEYNDSDGKTVYKVSIPRSLGNKTSTITRVIHSPSESDNQDVLEGRFVHLARIEFKAIGRLVIHYKGTEFDAREIYKVEGWKR